MSDPRAKAAPTAAPSPKPKKTKGFKAAKNRIAEFFKNLMQSLQAAPTPTPAPAGPENEKKAEPAPTPKPSMQNAKQEEEDEDDEEAARVFRARAPAPAMSRGQTGQTMQNMAENLLKQDPKKVGKAIDNSIPFGATAAMNLAMKAKALSVNKMVKLMDAARQPLQELHKAASKAAQGAKPGPDGKQTKNARSLTRLAKRAQKVDSLLERLNKHKKPAEQKPLLAALTKNMDKLAKNRFARHSTKLQKLNTTFQNTMNNHLGLKKKGSLGSLPTLTRQ